jgi:molybdopterin-guanine dinucleotide biosynthesis protein B
MKVLGLAGWSGSGKTTLLLALLPLFRARGLTVSTIKHAHHGFDLDRPGKDSFRHRAAGAHEVLVASETRWALLHENAGEAMDFADLFTHLSPVDLVLVEGFKRAPYPKIEVFRPALGKPPLWPEEPDIVAVASDAALPGCDRPLLALDAPGTIAHWAAQHLGLPAPAQSA